MKYYRSNEKGKTFVEIVRMVIITSVTLLLLFVVGKWFYRVMFEDSVVDSTFKEVSSRAITASSRFIHGNDNLVGSEFGPRTEKGYPVLTYKINGDFFEITLVGVPEAVCRRIVERKWSLPTSLYINGNLTSDSQHFCSDFNLVSFEFKRDLNSNVPNSEKPRKKHCRTDSDCSACEACRNNLCTTGCNAGESCSLDLKGNSLCCSERQNIDSFCCSYIENGQCCWGRDKCCPVDKPIILADGTCTNCYDNKPFSINDNVDVCLELCPNRIPFGMNNLCMLPICRAEQFMSLNGDCVDCQKEGSFKTSEQECAKCPNRIYQDGWCSVPCPEQTIQNNLGLCVSCDIPEAIVVENGDSCEKMCPNRQMEQDVCVLKNCPEGSVADQKGNCVSCDQKEAINLINPADCSICPNRELVGLSCVLPCEEGSFRALDGKCISCLNKEAFPLMPASGECLKCPNRMALENYCFASCKQGEFRDSNGACRSCLSLNSYLVPQTASCSICPYRSILLKQERDGNKIYCKLQQCPIDYFSDENGACYDCFVNEVIFNTSEEECLKCPNRMWSPENHMCLVRPSCPVNSFSDSYGQCQQCDSMNALISVLGHPEECAKCPDRYVDGYWCRSCPEAVDGLKTKEACQTCGGKWDNRIQQCS